MVGVEVCDGVRVLEGVKVGVPVFVGVEVCDGVRVVVEVAVGPLETGPM